MARYEHLPVYRSAMKPALRLVETTVRGFLRFPSECGVSGACDSGDQAGGMGGGDYQHPVGFRFVTIDNPG